MPPNRFLIPIPMYIGIGTALINRRGCSAITYGHDQANRMTGLNQGGVARAQGYDLAGNLTLGRGVSLGDAYTYRYDHLNQLTAVYDSAGTTRKGAGTHDALGRRRRSLRPEGARALPGVS